MSASSDERQPEPPRSPSALFAFPVVRQRDANRSEFLEALRLSPAAIDLGDTCPLLRPEVETVVALVRSLLPESTTDPVALNATPSLPEGFDGRSFMLAFFLAATACYRKPLPWAARFARRKVPIWATGELEPNGAVVAVRDDDFDAKMEGFLNHDDAATLFIVPSLNWSNYESRHATLLKNIPVVVVSILSPEVVEVVARHTGRHERVVVHVPADPQGSSQTLLRLTNVIFSPDPYTNVDFVRLTIVPSFMALFPLRVTLVTLEIATYVSLGLVLMHTARPFGDSMPFAAWAFKGAFLAAAWVILTSATRSYTRLKEGIWRHTRFAIWAALLWLPTLPRAPGPLRRGLLTSTGVVITASTLMTTLAMMRAAWFVRLATAIVAGLAATWMSKAAIGPIDIGRLTTRHSRTGTYAFFARASVLLPAVVLVPLFMLAPGPNMFVWLICLAVVLGTVPRASTERIVRALLVRLLLLCSLALLVPAVIFLMRSRLHLPMAWPEPPWEMYVLHPWPLPAAQVVFIGTSLIATRILSSRAVKRIADLSDGLRWIDEYRFGAAPPQPERGTTELFLAFLVGEEHARTAPVQQEKRHSPPSTPSSGRDARTFRQ